MDIEPLNTFDILAMLDVPVLPADHVMGYVDISKMVCNTDPAWTLGKKGVISSIHLDVPHRILDSKSL